MEKIKNIEFLRFALILSVIATHLKQVLGMFADKIPMYNAMKSAINWGWLSVDCFFMIAGFFMFLKTDFSQNFYNFAKKKFMRLMPLLWISLLLMLIVSTFTPIRLSFCDDIFMILNIHNVGLTFRTGDIGPSWFLSALFWTMCFYFYLKKCINEKLFNLITACIILFCYSFFIHSHVGHYLNEAFVFNIGVMRAFAGLGVGYFLAMIYKDNYEKIQNTVLNIYQKLLLTAGEIVIFGFIFWNTCFHKMQYNNKMIIIISYIALLGLFIYKKGYFSRILDNNFSVFLGQFTFSIFVNHILIVKLWTIYICKQHFDWVISHPVLNIFLLYVVIFLFSMLVYYFAEKPCAEYLKKKL